MAGYIWITNQAKPSVCTARSHVIKHTSWLNCGLLIPTWRRALSRKFSEDDRCVCGAAETVLRHGGGLHQDLFMHSIHDHADLKIRNRGTLA